MRFRRGAGEAAGFFAGEPQGPRTQSAVSKKQGSNKVSTRGAWIPRLVFWLLVTSVVLLGAAELLNVMQRPSLSRFTGPALANHFVIYQKGRAGNREAWLLVEPQAESGPAACFQRIDCTEADRITGDLRWSFDGAAIYAARRKASTIDGTDRPLWVYEFNTRKLWSGDDQPLAHQLPMNAATEAGLVDIINRHGGKGPVAVSWYDLGKRGDYLFAWQITRWEQALPQKK